MNQPKIGGIGEILWDVLPDREVLGGAPVNFVHHVSERGSQGIGISTIGNDQRGRCTLHERADQGIDHSCISISEHFPTGYVIAHVDQDGVATYRFPDRVANKIAAYVCSQPGAMVNIPDDLKYQRAKGGLIKDESDRR